jgi:hypothetical protein
VGTSSGLDSELGSPCMLLLQRMGLAEAGSGDHGRSASGLDWDSDPGSDSTLHTSLVGSVRWGSSWA